MAGLQKPPETIGREWAQPREGCTQKAQLGDRLVHRDLDVMEQAAGALRHVAGETHETLVAKVSREGRWSYRSYLRFKQRHSTAQMFTGAWTPSSKASAACPCTCRPKVVATRVPAIQTIPVPYLVSVEGHWLSPLLEVPEV